jgi:hypothetical protein
LPPECAASEHRYGASCAASCDEPCNATRRDAVRDDAMRTMLRQGYAQGWSRRWVDPGPDPTCIARQPARYSPELRAGFRSASTKSASWTGPSSRSVSGGTTRPESTSWSAGGRVQESLQSPRSLRSLELDGRMNDVLSLKRQAGYNSSDRRDRRSGLRAVLLSRICGGSGATECECECAGRAVPGPRVISCSRVECREKSLQSAAGRSYTAAPPRRSGR